MDIKKRSTNFGAALILFAVFLRLVGLLPIAAHSLRQPPTTGPHWSKGPQNILSAVQTLPWEPTQPSVPSAPTGPDFGPEELALVRLRYASDCALRADLEALLYQPLEWSLCKEAPTVLILHSHTTESYTLTDGRQDPSWDSYRSLSAHENMVAVGTQLAKMLEAGGIRVIHDQRLHDHPQYDAAYANSRRAAEEYLQQYPSLLLVLDLHRDAALNPDGSQYATAAWVDGRRSAQLMLVMGSGQYAWEENLSLGLKLQVVLETLAPGITRPTVLRAQGFNQDLLPGAVLVEVGTAGNTLEEALLAVSVLAEAILALAPGTTGSSTS